MNRHAPSIYVEIFIRGTMQELWAKTQDPKLHERWDLRFTKIEYLPQETPDVPQRFLYATRIGFGIEIRGEGESVGDVSQSNGQRISALKFWSDDAKSLIHQGSGYWKYTPHDKGIRFETGYDYDVRFGLFGEIFDRFVFRPLIGWATAWSFDRLRLWIEQKKDPAETLLLSANYAGARIMLAVTSFVLVLGLIFSWNGALFWNVPINLTLVGLVLLWVWQTRSLHTNIPFARRCRRERGANE